MSEHHKNEALLFFIVCLGILCLLLVACSSHGDADDIDTASQGPTIDIDPDKFVLSLEDKSTNKNNFVVAKITPGSPNMNLGEFLVTASIVDNKGIVRGAANKQGSKRPAYTAELSGCSVATLPYSTLKAKQENQGQPIKFRVQAMPGATIKWRDRYTLNVKIEYKGANPHTETKNITLTAKQNGVDTKTQPEEATTSGTSPQTPVAALGTVSGDTTPSTGLPMPAGEESTPEELPQNPVPDPSVPSNSAVSDTGQRHTESDDNTIDHNTKDAPSNNAAPSSPTMGMRTTNTKTSIPVASPAGRPNSTAPDTVDSTTADSANDTPTSSQQGGEAQQVQTEEQSNSEEHPKTPVSSPSAPLHRTPPSPSPGQTTDSSEDATAESSDNASTSAQQPASNQFTVTLKDVTRRNCTKNFVIVTIQPSDNGMNLEDFFVTASLSDSNGSIKGSSGRKSNAFVYDKELNNCNLKELFLTNKESNFLGENDTRFAQNKAVSFRIESKPGATTKPGEPYTLTIKVERKGSNLLETKNITLTAPKSQSTQAQRMMQR